MAHGIKTVGIIGGGVSGLAAGVRLAKSGVHVRIFEARPHAGGCCSTTTIDGFTFNDGALYLAVPHILEHAFAQLGMNLPEILPLVKISAPQTTYFLMERVWSSVKGWMFTYSAPMASERRWTCRD